jgi:hypothetical protein
MMQQDTVPSATSAQERLRIARQLGERDLNMSPNYAETLHEPIPLPVMVNNADADQFTIANEHILSLNTIIPTVANAFDPTYYQIDN